MIVICPALNRELDWVFGGMALKALGGAWHEWDIFSVGALLQDIQPYTKASTVSARRSIAALACQCPLG